MIAPGVRFNYNFFYFVSQLISSIKRVNEISGGEVDEGVREKHHILSFPLDVAKTDKKVK